MSAVVYSFSLERGLAQVPGAAPLAILARQIPRQVVLGLNAGEDRSLRFFPFMGKIEGTRQFFELPEQLPIRDLLSLHGQKDAPAVLVDGWIHQGGLRLRIFEGTSGKVLFEEDLPFDALDPFKAVQRIQFELQGCLRWSGAPASVPDLSDEAVGWFLIARDDLLALEANHLRTDPARNLRAIGEAFARSPGSNDVRQLLLEISRLLVQQEVAREAVVSLLLAAAAALQDQGSPFMEELGAIVEAAGGMAASLSIYERLAEVNPAGEAALKAGIVLFRQGHHDRARSVLRGAFENGNRSLRLRAQLAVVEIECGDHAAGEVLLEQLAQEDGLSPAVTRLVSNHLLCRDRFDEALGLIDRALSKAKENSGLHLDRGRALLALRRAREAEEAFRSCLARNPCREVKQEVRRYLTLVDDPATLSMIGKLEVALSSGELNKAVSIAKGLRKAKPKLAEAWLLYGVARQRRGHTRRALRAYRRALSLDADLGEAHNRLGILLVQQGAAAEGYIHLRHAVEACPDDSAPWLHLAQACMVIEKVGEAKVAIAKAEELGGHEKEAAAVRRAMTLP